MGYTTFTPNDINALLLHCIKILNNTRQIQRLKSTENATCMLSKTDRLATNVRRKGTQIWLCLVCFKLTLERRKRSGRYILN